MNLQNLRAERIQRILEQQLPSSDSTPIIKIEDESQMHSRGGAETHLKIMVVSSAFEGQSRVARQRTVQDLVKEEFGNGLHALSLRCLTPTEYKSTQDFQSPPCAGASDQDK